MHRQKTYMPESEGALSTYESEMPWRTYESEGDPLLTWYQRGGGPRLGMRLTWQFISCVTLKPTRLQIALPIAPSRLIEYSWMTMTL
jgi:hypothetical protein